MSSTDTEFSRTPVPESARLGPGSFIGQYAGEHTAGTELMIGPLFVASGVGARDLLLGLLLGNLLAVLSWTVLTAPIATRTRLTLYHHLELICGLRLVSVYNLVNGIAFCFLAGSMITVSATAVGVWFNFPMPGLGDLWPNSIGWVLAVLVIGTLISAVAARGYQTVARFANLAAPWMVVVFITFGLVGLRDFITATDATATTLGDLWTLAGTTIWKGGEPLPGQVKFTFWHVVFFAWFCNMAMHVGMGDLSVFRFARKARYGLASATGMYLGHFVAWIAASILYALQLHRDPSQTAVLPGPLAAAACGFTGLLCVIIAGWTTANPTIYRAGLAFQSLLPSWSRARVTFATGLGCALAGLFPAIAMRLLDFVAVYGLILMPMGAVIFCDVWLLPRLGLASNFASLRDGRLNPAPLAAWTGTVAVCLWAVQTGRVDLFFASLPGWFLASVLYLVASFLVQRRSQLSRV